MADQDDKKLTVILEEYKTLKAEQFQRIKVRDSIIYLMIVSIGVLVSLVGKLSSGNVLLVIPWASVVLGWTYLVNDEKVSSIGRYIRFKLDDDVKSILGTKNDMFGWESAHRSDTRRKERKVFQFFIDQIVFVLPSIVAIFAYFAEYYEEPFTVYSLFTEMYGLIIVELLLIAYLAWKIYNYADFKWGK